MTSPEKETPLGPECLAAEGKPGGIEALQSRIDRYGKARERGLVSEEYARTHGYDKQAQKLASCGEWLLFRHYFQIDDLRLHAANFCKQHLLCPLCAIRRGAKAIEAYSQRLEVVRGSGAVFEPFLVTFTVQHSAADDLAERVRHLRRSLDKMMTARRRYLSNPKKNPHVEAARSLGGVSSIEVTRGENGWHPHSHMIWLCASPPDQDKLRQEWRDWTGDSFMVDVRPITDLAGGFQEVFKYALKFNGLDVADQFAAYDVLRGQRMISSHGVLYGVDIPEELTDPGLDDEPFVEYLWRHFAGMGYGLKAAENRHFQK